MKSKEFITSQLKKLYAMFNEIKIRYEYRTSTNSHVIEIIPLVFFENNEEYMNMEVQIEDKFETLFPKENIVFISEGSLTEILKPDFKLGYNEIEFNNEMRNIDFIVKGFNEGIELQVENNFALAA